jgi:hypothetical protein
MITISDLEHLETATEVSEIYGGNSRRTFNGGSTSRRPSPIINFVNTRQSALANIDGSGGISIGNVALAFNVSIVNIVAISN